MRELEQWMPDGNDDDVDLDLGGSSNGWSAHEMFAKNKEFGVETSYDPNMSGYTTQLTRTKENSAEYKERERKAAQIAAEIEGNTHSIAAVELENGDEEEAFSAVARDKSSPGAGDKDKYVPPGRRDQGPGRGGRGGAQAPGNLQLGANLQPQSELRPPDQVLQREQSVQGRLGQRQLET